MAAINYVPGVGYVMDAPGSTQQTVIGSPEYQAGVEASKEREKQMWETSGYDWDKDYSGGYSGLFGAAADSASRPSFSGAKYDLSDYTQGSWASHLTDRIRAAEGQEGKEGAFTGKAGGGYGTHGYSELTAIQSYGPQILERNNAIFDMYRRGYSRDQIRDHLEGRINIQETEPSWSDYFTQQEQGKDTSFYIGAPKNRGEFVGQRLSTALDTIADRFNKAFGNTSFGIDDAPISQPAATQEENQVTRGLFGKYINKGQEQ